MSSTHTAQEQVCENGETELLGKDDESTAKSRENGIPVETNGTDNQIDNEEGINTPAEDPLETAQERLNAGKRNLACDEYPQAVEALAVACQLLSEKYGEEGDELAEAYLYYGRALLDLARMENGVLGNALDGVAAEEEDEADLSESNQFEKTSGIQEEEREQLRNDVYSAMSAENKEKSNDENLEAGKAGETENKEGEKMDEAVTEPAANSSEGEAEGEDTDAAEKTDAAENAEEGEEGSADDEAETTSSQDEEEDADDVPHLQLAWEVLELSKKIYSKQAEAENCDKSIKRKLCDVFRTLGEVSLESGGYDQAIQDITSCLELQMTCLDEDSRLIAETHYQLGTSHLLNKSYLIAVEELRKAKFIIELRISNLSESLCGELKQEEKEACQKELDQLKMLLPDVTAKVEDAEDESQSVDKAENEIRQAISAQNGTMTIGFGDSSATTDSTATTIATKKASDISNLVRKRKPEDQSEEEAKKAKTESNGAAGDKENGSAALTTPTN